MYCLTLALARTLACFRTRGTSVRRSALPSPGTHIWKRGVLQLDLQIPANRSVHPVASSTPISLAHSNPRTTQQQGSQQNFSKHEPKSPYEGRRKAAPPAAGTRVPKTEPLCRDGAAATIEAISPSSECKCTPASSKVEYVLNEAPSRDCHQTLVRMTFPGFGYDDVTARYCLPRHDLSVQPDATSTTAPGPGLLFMYARIIDSATLHTSAKKRREET
jgi:hypothetical protein